LKYQPKSQELLFIGSLEYPVSGYTHTVFYERTYTATIHSFIYLFQTTEVHRHIHKNMHIHKNTQDRQTEKTLTEHVIQYRYRKLTWQARTSH